MVLAVAGLLCGASIGREGPTVHVGAIIMRALARFMPHGGTQAQQRAMILAGGAAGVAAAFNTPLLLLGESGCDREALARFVHQSGPTAAGPWVVLDSRTLSDDSAASRLLGPEGSQPGSRLRLKGLGVPHVNASGRGDLFVHIDVRIPLKMTREQRKLFDQLHEMLPAENEPTEKGLLDKVKDYFM